MEEKTYGSRQAAEAANISRTQLDQWISQGYFKPATTPAIGTARQYTFRDMMALAVLAELRRLGVDLKPFKENPFYFAVEHLSLFTDDEAFLVIWHGPVTLKMGANVVKHENPDYPVIQSDIVRARELALFLNDEDKRATITVNLDHIERRVIEAAATVPAE
jgi:hypothetical protein